MALTHSTPTCGSCPLNNEGSYRTVPNSCKGWLKVTALPTAETKTVLLTLRSLRGPLSRPPPVPRPQLRQQSDPHGSATVGMAAPLPSPQSQSQRSRPGSPSRACRPYAQQDHAEDDADHPDEPRALEVAAAIAHPLRTRHPAVQRGAAGRRRR